MNIKLSKEDKFRLLQNVSGNYLTDCLPSNWEELDEDDQDEFLSDHAWEPFEYSSTNWVMQQIDSAHSSAITFIENLEIS